MSKMHSPWNFHYDASKSHLDTEENVKYPTPTSVLLMSGEETSLEEEVTLVPHEPLQREYN